MYSASDCLYRKPMLCKQHGREKDLGMQGWLYNDKYDGNRIKVGKADGKIDMVTRDGISYGEIGHLPEFTVDLEKFPDNTVADGEIVYFNQQGEIEFTHCQQRCAKKTKDAQWKQYVRDYPLKLILFDLLMLNGVLLVHDPLVKRIAHLKNFIEANNFENIMFAPFYSPEESIALYPKTKEGVVAKAINSPYAFGSRGAWLKIKHIDDDNVHTVCNVVGYTAGNGERMPYFGSLVLEQNGKWVCNIGGGFNIPNLKKITQLLKNSPKITAPFLIDELYTPVETDLKIEIAYGEITKKGHYRFPKLLKIIYPEKMPVEDEPEKPRKELDLLQLLAL